ncbi:hypothetical protein Agub_g7316 [Astrephomene gubernaculifera]|uniref:Mandelate racemase/muconate lactonizing enzyme C-terminal domain-containing protein n=1 Tax=Astrephomene gubernaculifera TaxID=47775 RepID=A0AAD3DPX6_9CHLO|nr:hypothetical protein Agub_g7316 [Astrephomene gubernaculifera]
MYAKKMTRTLSSGALAAQQHPNSVHTTTPHPFSRKRPAPFTSQRCGQASSRNSPASASSMRSGNHPGSRIPATAVGVSTATTTAIATVETTPEALSASNDASPAQQAAPNMRVGVGCTHGANSSGDGSSGHSGAALMASQGLPASVTAVVDGQRQQQQLLDSAPTAAEDSTTQPLRQRQGQPNMLLLPVAVCTTLTLTPESTLADAAAALLRHLPAAAADNAAHPSGVVRIEIAVPRTATTALRWLAGQQQQQHQPPQPNQQPHLSSPAALGPFLYFSGRRSSAPDTPGASAAEAATRGWSALAGAGAAWRWWGPGSGGFGSGVVSALQRFLSPDQPRVRILGGVRFDLRRQPDPEWAPFGSHCFVLPLLELTEAEDACLLAVTLAWDPAAAAAAAEEAAVAAGVTLDASASAAGDAAEAAAAAGFVGCGSLRQAVARAEAALRSMRPPAHDSAYGLRVTRSELQHAPSKEEWDVNMAALLGSLQDGHDSGAPAAAALASLLDPSLARQEYLTHGQQGLDDLLAAMSLSAFNTTSKQQQFQANGDGLDAIRDLIDGKVTVSELTAMAAVQRPSLTARTNVNGGVGASKAAAAPPSQSLGSINNAGGDSSGSAVASAGMAAAMEQGPDTDGGEALSKVVMARRTSMRLEGRLDPLHVLQSLQERDPRAYQLYFAPGPSPASVPASPADGSSSPALLPGPAFLACTPERLYARTGRWVASEAVAGTRARGRGGDVEQDFWLSLDLLRSPKDHAEFCTVRDWIAAQLAGPCEDVHVEIRKSVLKQGSVQHLFGRVAARLRRGRNDAHLLAALHPTPAVCGRPREAALGYLEGLEAFDRGWYAGPFGWISGAGAEFVVAIRSGLVCPEINTNTSSSSTAGGSAHAEPQVGMAAAPAPARGQPLGPLLQQQQPRQQPQHQPPRLSPPAARVHLFAGVGVVRGSDPAAEWQELDLKIRPLSSSLLPSPLPDAAPNINVAWAGLLVEELCRLGVNMFCVAPGSRSSPLTHAIASHPRARLNVCIDERSLGFWALGYGRACPGRPAAVVTSSGTAVANLLPAVVEASLSGVPLLLLTADRPAELRDTAANQTIDQTKIFGGFVRWFFDLPPPAAEVPGRTALTTASTAFRAAVAGPQPGPVHINLQFREPLAPVEAPWPRDAFLRGLAAWQDSQLPYTSHISSTALPAAAMPSTANPAAVAVAANALLPYTNNNNAGMLHGAMELSGSSTAGGAAGCCSADVAGLQALLAGAERGLVVVGELIDPRDIVAARQICTTLGWPVAADVLSGLRVGAAPHPPTTTTTATANNNRMSYNNNNNSTSAVPFIVHHMDQLLLGDREWWRQLRPDVILQLGPHLTSKRLGQFMDWAAMGDEESGGVPWVYVAPHTLRHDPSHLVSHRAVMTLREFRDAVAVPAAAGAAASEGVGGLEAARCSPSDPWVGVRSSYGRMLLQLDEAVSHEIDLALSSLAPEVVSEPFIARCLARSLPPGHGLFIGNSMPIRDMDMFACPPSTSLAATTTTTTTTPGRHTQQESSLSPLGGVPSYPLSTPATSTSTHQTAPACSAAGSSRGGSSSCSSGGVSGVGGSANGGAVVGVPVAANRGASGIDGVLSTAAGFAEGLSRPTTLLVGDVSFLHDVNGLNLLRAGELRPPLTVVLVNNAGGGIFSFLPIASAVPEDEFTPLWATPQNVDLEAMCRAQGIPHQKVTTSEGLAPALQAAWGLNRHSVVEVVTERSSNVELHRVVQAAALRAAKHAQFLATRCSTAAAGTALGAAAATALPVAPSAPSAAVTAASFTIGGVAWRRYRLPLTQPLTTTATATSTKASSSSEGWCGSLFRGGSGAVSSSGWFREGLLLRLRLRWSDGREAGSGVGEVAPLPELHAESLEEAEVQVAALSRLLVGVPLPPSLALLGGRVEGWLRGRLGLGEPGWLLPSVRFGLECALLSALASSLNTNLTHLLAAPPPPQPPQPQPSQLSAATLTSSATPNERAQRVLVNGLLSPPVSGDEAADSAAAVAAATRLLAEGYTTIKVKVARRSDPCADARILAAIRTAVGPHVLLRADANRGWPSPEVAAAFGQAVAAAGVELEYLEEPTSDPRDMAAFYQLTGIPVAADESLDEGLLLLTSPPARSGGASGGGVYGNNAGGGGTAPSYSGPGLPTNRAAGLAAVVLKPAALGGVEAAVEVARWAQRRGVQVVVSSAFESSVGLAHLLQLAAALDANTPSNTSSSSGSSGTTSSSATSCVHHGFGTLQWFAADISHEPLQLAPQLLPPSSSPACSSSSTSSASPASIGAAAADRMGTAGRACKDGDFVPLQAVCGSVEQANRVLQACAHGSGLRPQALVPFDICPTPANSNGNSSASSSNNGSSSSSCCCSTHEQEETSEPAHLRDKHSGHVDPWVGPAAQGGIVQRQICVEVELPPAQQSATQATRPRHHTAQQGSQHGAQQGSSPQQPQGSAAATASSPLRVLVCGLEVLPSSHPQPHSPGFTDLNNHQQHHGSSSDQQRPQQPQTPPFLFLHGFLGSSADWLPLMHALAAAGHRCVALDLPGHGGTAPCATAPAAVADDATTATDSGCVDTNGPAFAAGKVDAGLQQQQERDQLSVSGAHSISGAAGCVVAAARQLGLEGAVLVGYSLGARVTLQAVVKDGNQCNGEGSKDQKTGDGHAASPPEQGTPLWLGAVLISGTPGIKDAAQAAARAANDDRLATSLVQSGLPDFVRKWYEQPLWSSLRRHPAFGRMLARRTGSAAAAAVQMADGAGLAGVKLASPHDGSSTGTSAPPMATTAAPTAAEAAAGAAAALSGMSTGRMAPLWDSLDPWVGPPLVLVVGDLDAKFVDINTHMLARLVRQRATAAAAAATSSTVAANSTICPSARAVADDTTAQQPQPTLQPQQVHGGGSGMGVTDQLRQLGHALVRVRDVGHAVHEEAPERLLGVLREAAVALAAPGMEQQQRD